VIFEFKSHEHSDLLSRFCINVEVGHRNWRTMPDFLSCVVVFQCGMQLKIQPILLTSSSYSTHFRSWEEGDDGSEGIAALGEAAPRR
jgi:hypothetical protein